MDNEIRVENLGPIGTLVVKFDHYGVTVLSAPNGSGKSILLDAVQSVAAGRGGLPLMDGQERGLVAGMGVRAVIMPRSTRTTGEFALDNLEGKLDLSTIVDPGIKDPVAADKRRIKALIALSGAKADPQLFRQHSAFADLEWDSVVQQDSLSTDDLIDMASHVARDFQYEARQWERAADADDAKAASIAEQLASVDTTSESDPDVLHQAYADANAAMTSLTSRASVKRQLDEAADDARKELQRWDSQDIGVDVEAAKQQVQDHESILTHLRTSIHTTEDQIGALQRKLAQLEKDLEVREVKLQEAEAAAKHVEIHVERRAYCLKKIAAADSYDAPSQEAIYLSKERLAEARRAMDDGVRVRDAKMLAPQVTTLQASAQARRERAAKLRAAASATDDVLSAALQSPVFKVCQVGSHKRVYTWHEGRGKDVEYNSLSDGERWTRAIDEGVSRVQENGMLFIRQEAWEGLDVWNRKAIHEYATQRKVFVLTLEATRDEADGREFVTKRPTS